MVSGLEYRNINIKFGTKLPTIWTLVLIKKANYFLGLSSSKEKENLNHFFPVHSSLKILHLGNAYSRSSLPSSSSQPRRSIAVHRLLRMRGLGPTRLPRNFIKLPNYLRNILLASGWACSVAQISQSRACLKFDTLSASNSARWRTFIIPKLP